jgi:hypothetical protein
MFGDQLNFLILISSLEGMREVDDFIAFRSAVFNAISLMTELANKLHARKS